MKGFCISCIAPLLAIVGCQTSSPKPVSGTIKAGNLQVFYERQGRGEPLLFLHAGLQNHTMWNDQVKALVKDYEIITLNLPFHGKTTGTDTLLLAQDLVRIVLDSLKLDKVTVVGLSMGASVAQDFVIAYPDRVSKAVFVSAGINGYDKKFPIDSLSMDWYYKFDAALKKGDKPLAAKEFTKAWAEGIYRSEDSLKAPVSQYVYNTTLQTLNEKQSGWPRLMDAPPALERLGSINVPVLIISGDKDLPYIITTSNYMAKTIPGARLVVMKDVAHMLNMEKPEEFNQLLVSFIEK